MIGLAASDHQLGDGPPRPPATAVHVTSHGVAAGRPDVVPTSARRDYSRLLRLHALRAEGALQLAAALVLAGSPPVATFVSFDERLRVAARLEGLTVI